jgi:hypothetical protein
MVLIHEFEKKKFQQRAIYTGASLKLPSIYLEKTGGTIGFVNLIKDNKDLISNIVSTAGTVANTAKSISDTVKASKETKKKGKKEYELTEAQKEVLKDLSIGNGFSKF